MPVIVPHAADPTHLVSTHKTRPTLATVAMVATVAIPATLTREPEFFRSAWAALAPLLWDIGQDLIEHHVFQAAGEVRTVSHVVRDPCPRRISELPWVHAMSSSKDPQLTQTRQTKASCLIWSSRRTSLHSVFACPHCLRTYHTSCRTQSSSSQAITRKSHVRVGLVSPIRYSTCAVPPTFS
jgi:hypothetical protein